MIRLWQTKMKRKRKRHRVPVAGFIHTKCSEFGPTIILRHRDLWRANESKWETEHFMRSFYLRYIYIYFLFSFYLFSFLIHNVGMSGAELLQQQQQQNQCSQQEWCGYNNNNKKKEKKLDTKMNDVKRAGKWWVAKPWNFIVWIPWCQTIVGRVFTWTRHITQ